MITPIGDAHGEIEVPDIKKKSSGGPGVIRTRNPQLRRPMREILKSVATSDDYSNF